MNHNDKHLLGILDECRKQGFGVEQTGAGHYKVTPPDKTKQIVYVASSGDHRAIKNALSSLKKAGFVPKVEEKLAKLATEVREGAAAPLLNLDETEEPEPLEVRMEKLFAELKEAKVLQALAREHEKECNEALLAAREKAERAAFERQITDEELQRKKAAFDAVFSTEAA